MFRLLGKKIITILRSKSLLNRTYVYHISFVVMLYVPVNNFSVMSGLFLGCASTKQKIKCLAPGHNAVSQVRLEPSTPRSQVKHSTDPLVSSVIFLDIYAELSKILYIR